MNATTPLNAIFKRVYTQASAATTTHGFTALVTNALLDEDLDTLVRIETEATKRTANLPTDSTAPLMTGIGRAVTDAAHREVTASTSSADDAPARARALLEVMDKNTTNWTPSGLRERGADHDTIRDAELAEAAETQLDTLMHQIHGDEWLTMMDEPLDRAIAAPPGNTIYRDALTAHVNAL